MCVKEESTTESEKYLDQATRQITLSLRHTANASKQRKDLKLQKTETKP